ncbi:nucleolar MIF4G domain-containing protein 1 homolog [Leguminivora glycinivorella]|uniref:nucleolar MIF4G domain-containing protein 1 homolog n=1 Tax=Leguminivora glycinivorella TaxID=1035111 RepID=UPI00200FF1AA|nr:nucleolar MIF4G domain-containing protein 1 homolog [Leguminivora glycinivorella]
MKKPKQAARASFPNIRKALRKQKRQQKKVHRQEHYLKKKTVQKQPKYTAGRFVKRPADSPEPDVEVKKKKQKTQPLPIDIIQKEREKEKKVADRLKAQMEEQRRKMFLEANEEEDRMIKKLEKQLGLNKIKNKKKFFEDDGLDYVLEICDRQTTEQIVAAEKHLANVEGESDFEEDLAAVTGKELKKTKDKKTKEAKTEDKSKKNSNSDDDDFSEENSDFGSDGDVNEDDMSDNAEMDEDMSGDDDDFGENSDNDDDGDDLSDEQESDEEPEEKPTKSSKSKQKTKETPPPKPEKKKSKERVVSEEELSKMFSDDEVSHLSDDDDLDGSDFGDEKDEVKEVKEKPDVWEDIYGRKRDKEGNVIKEDKGAYIPPHLRNKDTTTDQATAQLKRQIKSVLNKLAHTNLHWACTSIENLYSSNSRHSVSASLCGLWLEAVCGTVTAPLRLQAEYAALVGVLHANIGQEIGAHFLEELCTIFDRLTQTLQPMEDKTLDNVVCCLAYLYSFKIFHATLLYDILNSLLLNPTEKSIDCVLCAFRCAGASLRKDEPLALKTFIQDAQKQACMVQGGDQAGSRIKFLLEVLMAVKNNNLNKIPNYDPSFVEQLKKTVKGIIRKGNYATPLNITLEDLLKAETRGKWWVVGSAWEGNRPKPEEKVKAVPSTDQKLLELARKQRMNTDVRRSIFCVIMSAEDYMDAFEKLQHLGLKGSQEREIVHVLLACSTQERTYNPYYSVLAQKLCDVDRKYQLSIQFAVWDKIKDLESFSKQATTNLAQFLIHLIMEKGLALSVLKVIEFSDLNKSSVRFLRQILLAIIMNADLQASLQVFHRIAKSPKLHMFRESLRLFIQHFLLKNAGKKSVVLSEEEMGILKERTVEVERILTMFESKLKF